MAERLAHDARVSAATAGSLSRGLRRNATGDAYTLGDEGKPRLSNTGPGLVRRLRAGEFVMSKVTDRHNIVIRLIFAGCNLEAVKIETRNEFRRMGECGIELD